MALDPLNLQKRIIPLLWRDVTLNGRERITFPSPFNVLNRIDFRQGQDYDASFRDLIRRVQGRPKSRGNPGLPTILRTQGNTLLPENASPTELQETLIGNLLRIESLPDLIWGGNTEARQPGDVYKAVKTNEAFVLSDKRIYAFCDLSARMCSLNPVLANPPEVRPERLSDWLANPDKRALLVRLLNSCLKQHAYELFIGKDDKGRYYFRPDYLDDKKEKKQFPITRFYQLPGDTKPRAVAAEKINPLDQAPFWVHYAAHLRMELLGNDIFLRIEPTFIFTKDGKNPLDGKSVGRLSVQWTGKQQNPDVLRTVLFWARVLARGRSEIRIPAGGTFIVMKALPCHARTTFGIGGDYVRIAALNDPVGELDQIANEARLFDGEEGGDSEEAN